MAEPEITPQEAVDLGAVDTGLYGQFFFPKTCRQSTPWFHRDLYEALDDPERRYVSAMIFRGGAKTSALRVYTSKRIAYGISRTILLVSAAEVRAQQSLVWIRNSVQYNHRWANVFGLRKGGKWSDSWIEIMHGIDEVPINVVAVGMTGAIRGLNLDDHRPDLIIVDDPDDEESTNTPEQREKQSDLFFGSLARSLAPEADAPLAKMVLLQTPLNSADLINQTEQDPQWTCIRYPCFDRNGQSIWPERFPTETLIQEKEGYLKRNQISLWMREMECRIVSRETSSFLMEWYREWIDLPEHGYTVLAIDPVPPPKVNEGPNPKNDQAVVLVLRFSAGKVFVCDGYGTRGPDPDDFIESCFTLAQRWNVQKWAIETHAAQRTIATIVRRKMQEKRRYYQLDEVEDKRPKARRIVDDINPRASNGTLLFREGMDELKEQFHSYPDVNHDDWLDALSMGISSVPQALEFDYIDAEFEVLEEPQSEEWRACP